MRKGYPPPVGSKQEGFRECLETGEVETPGHLWRCHKTLNEGGGILLLVARGIPLWVLHRRGGTVAGRPFMRALEKRVEEMGGPEAVMDLIADGATVREVSAVLQCSRRYFYMWRDQPKWEGRLKEMWEEAMRLSAESEIERAMVEYDRLDRVIDRDPVTGEEIRRIPQSSEVQLVTGRAKFRQWLAARKDPERYGEKQEQQVTISIGNLHLDALQSVRAREQLPAPVVEAEIVVEDSEEG